MSPATITLLFLLFAIVMFVWEKDPTWGNFYDNLRGSCCNRGVRFQDCICGIY